MLQTVEKIIWGLTILVITSIGLYLGVAGAPSHWPTLALGSQEMTKDKFDKKFKPATPSPEASAPKSGTAPRRTAARSRVRYIEINEATFDSVAKLADAARLAKSVSSTVKQNPDGSNSLQVFGFTESSVMGTMGFVENDVIDRIGGLKIDFNDQYEAIRLYEEMRDKLADGEPLVIDVSRRGTPMQITVGYQGD